MKNVIKLVTLVIVFALVTPALADGTGQNGVDDLRGRWDIDVLSQGVDQIPPLRVFINDLSPDPDDPNVFLASGCMRSIGTEAMTPMALRAIDNLDGTYALVIISTVVPQAPFDEPLFIRFEGVVETFGDDVDDDTAVGTLSTQSSEGEWTAIHHDRRRTGCPAVDVSGLFFYTDLYVARDMASDPPSDGTILEGFTNIVSSKMQVKLPDGSILIAEPYTDLFSPQIDFVSGFRYLIDFEDTPSVDQPYTFTLLDILGNPIPGTESTDLWSGCTQGAPANLNAIYNYEESILLSWDNVYIAPGFDPESGVGFYQIAVSPFGFEGPNTYGANGISNIIHFIPWEDFTPGSSGVPDGTDYGDALEKFIDGTYLINVIAFAEAAPPSLGKGLECQVRDSSESLLIEKNGSNITINPIGSISGLGY